MRCAAGYGDGVLRLFDLSQLALEAKFAPHHTAVTAIAHSSDGLDSMLSLNHHLTDRVIISGSKSGVVIVSSSTTGMTLRALNDHRGAEVTFIDIGPVCFSH
jgi:hypothetical protein